MGVLVNTRTGRFLIEEGKLQQYIQICQTLSKKRSMRKREFASMVGKLNFGAKVAPVLRIMLRSAYRCLASSEGTWDKWIPISEEVRRDMFWLWENLQQIAVRGAPMWRSPRLLKLFTDAAGEENLGWGAVLEGVAARGTWSHQERNLLNHLKEMTAILHAIRTFHAEIQGRRLQVYTDNMAVYWALKNGGTEKSLAELRREIELQLVNLEAEIEDVVWIPSERMKVLGVDGLSRIMDPDDWIVKREIVQELWDRWGACDLDLFASEQNTVCPLFLARWWCPQACGVNAFAWSWTGFRCWIVPPVELIGVVVRYLLEEEQGCEGILVVPYWPSQSWWPDLQTIALDMLDLGRTEEVIIPRNPASGELLKNKEWRMVAVRL